MTDNFSTVSDADTTPAVDAKTGNETVDVKIEPGSSPSWTAEDDDDVDMGADTAEYSSAAILPIKTENKTDNLPAAPLIKIEDAAKLPVSTEDKFPMNAVPVDLEDLFDDDDDDFSGTKPTEEAFTATADLLSLQASDPEVMRSFYQRLFPWRYLFQWLNHSPTPTNDFAHREFAFTLQNDAYLRYQAFPTSDLYVTARCGIQCS